MRFKQHYLLSEFVTLYVNSGQLAEDIYKSATYKDPSEHPFNNHPLVRFVEAKAKQQSGTQGGIARQYASPEEDDMLWQHHANTLKGLGDKPFKTAGRSRTGDEDVPSAMPHIAKSMLRVTQSFEPIVMAFTDLVRQNNSSAAEIDDDQVKQWLKSKGMPQLPDIEVIKQSLGVKKLKLISDKVRNGFPLEGDEQQIADQWQRMSQQVGGRAFSMPPSVIKKVMAAKNKLEPETLTGQESQLWQSFVRSMQNSPVHDPNSANIAISNYLKRASDHYGSQGGNQDGGFSLDPLSAYNKLSRMMPIISDEEALSTAIDKVRFEFSQAASISGGTDNSAKRAAERLAGDEYRSGRIGGTHPASHPGAKQYLTGKIAQTEKLGKNDFRPTGKEDDISVGQPPNWYFGANAGHGPSKEINAMYEKDQEAYKNEVLRAACHGVTTAISTQLKKSDIKLFHITNQKLGGISQGDCGFDLNDPNVQQDWETIHNYLDQHNIEMGFTGLVDQVAKMLLNATGAPDFRTNEDRRNGLATLYGTRLLHNAMYSKKVRSSNIAPTGDEGPKGDYSDMGSGSFSNEKGKSTGKERDELMSKIKSNKDKDFEDIIAQIPNKDDADLLRQITDIVKRGRPADDDEAETLELITDLREKYPDIMSQWQDRFGY